jgi:hypothetical protein
VYHVRWNHGNFSPLLLGLAVAIGASDWHVRNVTARMRLQLLLPLVAIALAVPSRSALSFEIDQTVMTPLRLTLLASVLVYIHGLLLHRHPYFGMAGTMCLCAAGLGENPATMTRSLAQIGDKGASTFWRLVPRTLAQWGIVSVVASFVLLVAGVVVSLLRPPRAEIRDLGELN